MAKPVWTYGYSPATSDIDKVRLLIGDTDASSKKVYDSEIAWALTENNDNAYLAGADLCEALASKYLATPTSKSVGSLSISYKDEADKFFTKAKQLRDRHMNYSALTPFMGGKTISDKDARDSDPDVIHGEFDKGMHDDLDSGSDKAPSFIGTQN